MRTWQCIVSISIFVLLWYFSEFEQIWTQALCCFLCLMNFTLRNQDCNKKQARLETSTQTDDTDEETELQTKTGHHVGVIDEIDATRSGQTLSQTMQYPNTQRSLLQVFECAYAHLVKPWYTVPELVDSQPLHRALQTEFNLIVERVICKAENFNLSVTSVGCIRIFTQHLHKAKQSDGSPMFGSRSEEMAVLRSFSEALVRNLFPEYLLEAKLYQCFLNEIVATKALDVLVTYLCNPDNLNQMLVSQLDRVSSESSTGDRPNSDRKGTPSPVGCKKEEGFTDEAEDALSEVKKEKKKGNRVKEKIYKIVDKVKSKKPKKKKPKEENTILARGSAAMAADDESSRESSIRSNMDSDYDSETDVYLTTFFQEDMMEFKLPYEMWRVGKWAVRVTNVQRENEELCFTVHLEERNNPENLNWDVKKTQTDILQFHNLWQESEEMGSSTLPSVSAIVEKTKNDLDGAHIEEVRSALEHFLQELVSDTQLGQTLLVFQFLCPIALLLSNNEDNGGVWSFLNGLASFLTPGKDEDESHNPRGEDKLDEAGASVHHSGPMAQPACMDTNEEPKEDIIEGPIATNVRFRNGEPETEDQTSDEQDVVSDGRESPAESLDVSVNTSKLVSPSGHLSDSSSLQFDSVDGFTSAQTVEKTNKKEKLTHKKLNVEQKLKVKEKTGQLKEEKKESQTNVEQTEATKAIFELLKEIIVSSGNSVLIFLFDALLKAVQPLVKKKINNFLKMMHPTEVQIASYIDNFRENIWPEGNVPIQPPRDSEEKHATMEKALQLINSNLIVVVVLDSNVLILKKTEVETLFKIFQDTEENKKLVYKLLSYVLREFLPGETAKDFVF
ncbi:uncharacterized protein LOC113057754 isoform X2 [Carassius auratus]|uniref:Uncharacterized protein LOC113057754 isoform X2 n=1 Tax=Carassius auratus TaxID=7957 RepID=A0A6P6L931_CARAU|nr:uncharacterized protein LOC113057754 isoform X2 [Carassius auratus]